MTFSTLRGLGVDVSELDGGSVATENVGANQDYNTLVNANASGSGYTSGAWDTTLPSISNPFAGSSAGGYTPSGNASSGFNWGSFFSGILPTVFNDATKIGQQAIATPGTVIGPNGQVVTGGGVMSAPKSTTAMNISAMMPVILLGVGGVLLITIMKGRR